MTRIIHEYYFYIFYKIHRKIFGEGWANVKKIALGRGVGGICMLHLALLFLIFREINPKIYGIEVVFWFVTLFYEIFLSNKSLKGDRYLAVIARLDNLRKSGNYWPFIGVYLIFPSLIFVYFYLSVR